MATVNSYVFPAVGLGYARDACVAPFSGITPAAGLTNLVTASYEAGPIYTFSAVTSGISGLVPGVSGLIPIPTPNSNADLFGDIIYQELGGQLPTTLAFGGLDFLNGAYGGAAWVAFSVSAGHSLQIQSTGGGIPGGVLGFNSNIPNINLTIVGNELYQISYQIVDNTPQQVLFQFYESTLGWHNIYFGTDQFGFGGANLGPVPLTIGSWITFTVTNAQLGLTPGMVITGLSWGVWSPANITCTVWFSDETNLNGQAITQFVDCDQDGGVGFYVLARQNLIHVPQVSVPPIVPITIPLSISPSFVYTGLIYNSQYGKPYFIGYDGSVYSYNGATVSSVTAPPSGVTAPARQLYTDGNNLYTLFANSNVIASYSIPSSGWTLKTAFPFTGPTDTIYYSKDIGKLLAGGRNYVDTHFTATIADIGYALTPNQLVVADGSNTISFLAFTNAGWNLVQTVTGTGAPAELAAEPDGNQVLVTDTTNNVVQVLTYLAGNWSQTSTVPLTGPTSIAMWTSGVTQALVCQPSNNTVTVLNKSVFSWLVAQTLSIAGATSVAISNTASGTFAIVTTTTGVTFLKFNGALWQIIGSVALSPVPTQAASDFVNGTNSLLYAAGTSGGNTTVYVFQNDALVGQYTIAANLAQLDVINYQIFVTDMSGVINGGYYVNGVTNSAVVSGVTAPASGIASTWIPEVTDFFPFLLIANANDIWSFTVSKPQTVVRVTDSLVGVLTGSSWSTIDLMDRNLISSINTDTNGNIYAINIENELYKIASQTTIVSGYPYTLIPPTNQEEEVTLGLSRLIWWYNEIWSSSSLMGGLSIITPS